MKSINVTQAREKLFKLLDEVAASHEPVEIKGKRSSAILVSEEDWRAIRETLYLLSIPGMRDALAEGMSTPIEECAKELEW